LPTLPEKVLVTEDHIDEIVVLGMERMPLEACGVIFPDGTLFELTNVSETPEDSYEIKVPDLRTLITQMQTRWGVDAQLKDIVIWHTHPSGFVGPSRDDIKTKVAPEARYLVVALPDGEAVQF
jgi:proteasome lid subunit RPN8/RPN11